MLRTLLILLLSTAALWAAPAEPDIPPLQQIEQFGSICIGDGSSFFMFAKDGSFRSGPFGMSGRTMVGRWTKDANNRFVVLARLGWVNGLSPNDQYRRIVFSILSVTKRALELKVPSLSSTQVSDSYFLIDEMTIIEKPDIQFPE